MQLWSDELTRSFAFDTQAQALDFLVAVIEIIEEAGLRLGLWLEGGVVRLAVAVSQDGAPENLSEILQTIEQEAHV